MEFGETVEDAVKRELKEELSVEAGVVALLGATDHILPERAYIGHRPFFWRGSHHRHAHERRER